MTALPPGERQARIRLARSNGIGPVGFNRLLAEHGSALAACAALLEAGRPLRATAMVEAEIAAVARLGARHLLAGDKDYPPLLAALADPPPLLVALGDASLGQRPTVSIVGARNASSAGRKLARHLAMDLGAAGWVVVSGLARGIDGAAHQGALATGTIGCVAGGVEIAYPSEHAQLQAAIAEEGLLLSELPPGTEPQARHFPRRNRLVAGVARGVVVIEAAAGSGSMITARLAADCGREVMAVPGHPADPRSKGGNRLIRDGATLIESAEDVLAALSPFTLMAESPPPRRRAMPRLQLGPPGKSTSPAGEGGLLALLSVEGVEVDELVRQSGLAAGEVQALLSDLEVEGQVARLAGGKVARRS